MTTYFETSINQLNLLSNVEGVGFLNNFTLQYQDLLDAFIENADAAEYRTISSALIEVDQGPFSIRLTANNLGPVGSAAELEEAINDGFATGELLSLEVSQGAVTFLKLEATPSGGLVLSSGTTQIVVDAVLPNSLENIYALIENLLALTVAEDLTASERTALISDLEDYGLSGLHLLDNGTEYLSLTADETGVTFTMLGFSLAFNGAFSDNFGVLAEAFFDSLTDDGQGILDLNAIEIRDPDGNVIGATIGDVIDPDDRTVLLVDDNEFDAVWTDTAQDGVENDGNIHLFFEDWSARWIYLGYGGDDYAQGGYYSDLMLGGDGDDTLDGIYGDNTLDGGAGADLLLGEGGQDSAQYAGSPAGVIVDLQTPAANTGEAAGDTFFSIENLIGSSHNDALRGDAAGNTLYGQDGVDILMGRAGADWLSGGEDKDILLGGTHGIYHTDVSAQIYRLYAAVLGREPDVGGHQGWAAQLSSGAFSLQRLAGLFVGSPEFQTTYGDSTNAEFVTLLYANVLNRTPSTVDRDYWAGRLDNGEARERVVLLFSETPEHQARTADAQNAYDAGGDITNWTDDVYRVYRAIFDRDPDAGGFLTWTDTLAAGRMSFAEVIESFMTSSEFQTTYGAASSNAEFVTLLYENVLKRAPDPNGLSNWVTALEGGAERADIVGSFMASSEFIQGTQADLISFIESLGPDDLLDPGAGDAVVSGGLFADTFVFVDDSLTSTVEVTDLESWDTLQFTGFGLSVEEIIGQMEQQGDDVVFVNDTETVIFADTALDDINASMISIA